MGKSRPQIIHVYPGHLPVSIRVEPVAATATPVTKTTIRGWWSFLGIVVFLLGASWVLINLVIERKVPADGVAGALALLALIAGCVDIAKGVDGIGTKAKERIELFAPIVQVYALAGAVIAAVAPNLFSA